MSERIRVHIIFDDNLGIDTKNVLIPRHHDVKMIMSGIRKYWIKEINQQKGLYLFFGGCEDKRGATIQPITKTLDIIHRELGILNDVYIFVQIENTFG